MNWSRRRVLSAAAAAGGAGLSGCLDGSPGGSGGDSVGPTLRTLDVEGSPGDEVPVNPEGTVALLDFFATWCAPCKPQMAVLRRVHERLPEVHVLSITNETDEATVKSFWRDYRGTWPVAIDGDLTVTSEYGATRKPTLLVLDREGGEVWRHVGLAAEDSIVENLDAAGAG